MPGHVHTSFRARPHAWTWLILATVVAVVAGSVVARAEGGPAPDSPASSTDPIDLAAHSVQVWNVGDEQWVVLRGEAAVFQGVDGIRASEAVVRVTRTVEGDTPTYQVDLYAEGQVVQSGKSGPPKPSWRSALTTGAVVRLRPYEKAGLVQMPGPPANLLILARAFPGSAVPAPTRQAPPIRVTTPSPGPRPIASQTPPARPLPTVAVRAAPRPQPITTEAEPTTAPLPPITQAESLPPPIVTQPATATAPLPPPIASQAATTPAPESPATQAEPLPELPSVGAGSRGDRDGLVVPTQFGGEGFPGDSVNLPTLPDEPSAPAIEAPRADGSAVVPNLSAPAPGQPTTVDPLPDGPTMVEPLPGSVLAPARPGRGGRRAAPAPSGPPTISIMPGTQRIMRIFPRDGESGFTQNTLPTVDGVETTVIKGGVIIVADAPQFGTLDISADNVVIWRQLDPKKAKSIGPNGEIVEDAGNPVELYLEGNVIIRQDERKVAGPGDQKTYRAKRAFYNLLTKRLVALDTELNVFAPGLIAPTKVFSPRMDQYVPLQQQPDGTYILGMEQIRADRTVMTGSRFPIPGYRFNSRSVDLNRKVSTKTNPNTGTTAGDPRDPNAPPNLTWEFDARQNVFYMGPVPVFYWPRINGDADDLEPPLRSIVYRENNYFGQSVLTGFNGFRVFGFKKPPMIDIWNIDVDYLQLRTKSFPALGTEVAWFGPDFLNDLADPYRNNKGAPPSVTRDYFGYFDVWGLRDYGVDDLGTGPAIVTGNRALEIKNGRRGFQRGPNNVPGVPHLGVPAFQDFRGRINTRHMQSFLSSDDEETRLDDYRLQVEAAYVSDRYFLEEYYKYLSETGMDQETLAYLIRQRQNTAWNVWTEANLQTFNTETQWLPRADYYRLGDSLLGNRLTYFQHSGADYGVTHTDVAVNNPRIFNFQPYDPISNTSGTLSTGRLYTNHEVDLPFNLDNIIRFVPYLQGQAVGWNNQIGGAGVGRLWGAAGIRADFNIWKRYPDVESELFNVHGLNHKVSFEADYRDAFSNVNLNQIGVQDDLDDNTYEGVRRYFALTNYANGILAPQYDPRFLILRRAISPITGTTDVQSSMNTLQFNLHSRLQTKRGVEGRRRVIDYMCLDLSSTYFPNAARDNFNKPFGQNTYNYQWFLGDRTSIVSYGWFEFFDITGKPTYQTNVSHINNPFGLNVITSGISISRPPRGNVFIGYSLLDTGPINTSALNGSLSYWLSPKWYGSVSNSYDFGNKIWLAAMFSLTRIGADYLTSIGLTVDPQRGSTMFAVQISPRASPNLRFGSGLGTSQFDSRYAPTQ